MDILDDMGVSKLSAKVFLNVNYSFKITVLKEYSDRNGYFWLNKSQILWWLWFQVPCHTHYRQTLTMTTERINRLN